MSGCDINAVEAHICAANPVCIEVHEKSLMCLETGITYNVGDMVLITDTDKTARIQSFRYYLDKQYAVLSRKLGLSIDTLVCKKLTSIKKVL